jgi:hypothetical protein
VTENETDENTVEHTCDECAWRSKENMVTGVFMMPKSLYEVIEQERENSIELESCEENCSEIFYGRRIAIGVFFEIKAKQLVMTPNGLFDFM